MNHLERNINLYTTINYLTIINDLLFRSPRGAGRSSEVVFAHGAMSRRIDPSWGGHIELFLVQAIAPRLV